MSTSRPPRIQLTEREQKLRGLLLDVAAHINQEGAREPVVLRWAGGWVRDKLLGLASQDIDTAINSMTGEAFALRLQALCTASGNDDGGGGGGVAARHGMGLEDLGHLHRIERNPDKSKHLETTTVRLFGLDVDMVNLRRETYTADSRNPTVEFGTPREDAARRDATVNALFYNLHTEAVEDFCGGLEDLERRVIRTPMAPLQTFMDDPLRVLRLVRFASRLEFALDPKAARVMSDPAVLAALRVKISRERVGVELEKMLKGKHALVSLQLIDRLGLYHTIFTDATRDQFPQPDLTTWHKAYECLHFLSENSTPGSLYEQTVQTDEAKYYAWMLAAVAPFKALPDEPGVKAGKPPLSLAAQAAREGVKAPTKLCDVITSVHRHRSSVLALKALVDDKKPARQERDRFGMAIREWNGRDGQWRLHVLYALLVDVMERAEGARDTALTEWQRFLDHLAELDVMDAPSLKRLVDGKQLADALGARPGKWMTPALDMVTAWQLRNPGVTDPAGVIEELRRRRPELGIQ